MKKGKITPLIRFPRKFRNHLSPNYEGNLSISTAIVDMGTHTMICAWKNSQKGHDLHFTVITGQFSKPGSQVCFDHS